MFHEVEMFAANWLIRNRLRSTEFNRNQQVLESGSGPGVGDEATRFCWDFLRTLRRAVVQPIYFPSLIDHFPI